MDGSLAHMIINQTRDLIAVIVVYQARVILTVGDMVIGYDLERHDSGGWWYLKAQVFSLSILATTGTYVGHL